MKPLWKRAKDLARAAEVKALDARNLRPDGKTPLSPVPGVKPGFPFGAHPTPPNRYKNPQNRHTGCDWPGQHGDDVRALKKGQVIFTGFDADYGNNVMIKNDDDGRVWRFCHLSKISVRYGEHVSPNDKVGEVGSTGHVFGPHLHLELSKGTTWRYNDVRDPQKGW